MLDGLLVYRLGYKLFDELDDLRIDKKDLVDHMTGAISIKEVQERHIGAQGCQMGHQGQVVCPLNVVNC
jgi:hypothetical protein